MVAARVGEISSGRSGISEEDMRQGYLWSGW